MKILSKYNYNSNKEYGTINWTKGKGNVLRKLLKNCAFLRDIIFQGEKGRILKE